MGCVYMYISTNAGGQERTAHVDPDEVPYPMSCKIDPNDTCRWQTKRTEYEDKFEEPVTRRARCKPTRNQRMDTFLWSTMAKEYLKRIDERAKELSETEVYLDTEYDVEYHKLAPDTTVEDERMQKMYPLHGTVAITYWSPKVASRAPHRRGNCLTKPNAECYDQQFR